MVWKGIKLEFYRAFHNIWYVLALAAAIVISLLQFFLRVLPQTGVIGDGAGNSYPESVFNNCLMFDAGSYYGYLYYYSIILLAAVPFAATYYRDIREGYVKNVVMRMDIKGYMIGKYLAVFVSAGSICVIPLIINTYLTAMVIPSLIPQAGTSLFPVILTGTFGKELFYTHPYVYTMMYLFIDFMMAGLYSCLALPVSKAVNNRYIIMFLPFLAFILFQTVIGYSPFSELGPYFIMAPYQPKWESAVAIFGEMAALAVLTAIGFWMIGGRKRDTL